MKKTLFFLLLLGVLNTRLNAQAGVIVRDSLGELALRTTCLLLGCTVNQGLDGTLGNVFVITAPVAVPLETFLQTLSGQLGIVSAEPDQILHVMQSQPLTAPNGLWDTTPVNYYGTDAWHGYTAQPAVGIINLQAAQSQNFGSVTGAGIVAVIDTGIDPGHWVFHSVLVPGKDFTRNQDGGSEMGDVNQQSMAVVNGAAPAQVNQQSMAVVNQDGKNTFSQSQYAAFGHGTMVAGIVHLVAPTAQIMPLKAFRSDGTGKLSDVLRAVYYATQHNAGVMNMSFDFPTYSRELARSIDYATGRGVVAIASVGNDAQQIVVYPAGLSNVIGVASTTNTDTLSSFSNFGKPPVWLAAPGEGIISTYPFGTYAAGWGTSFSTPLVTGTVALMRSVNPSLNQQSAAQALTHAVYISPALGYGRLDAFQAVACQISQTC